MQIVWNGGNYHADCIGEVLAQKRAAEEKPLEISPTDFEALEDEEPFEDEFTDYEIDDDDLEDIIDRLEDEPEVSDEILNQIPVSVTNGDNGGVRISEIVSATVAVATVEGNGSVGKLISGATTMLINREALKYLPVPPSTDTFQPIPHHELVEQIHECLSFRRLSVAREEFAVSPDGMKLFGLLELNVEYSGVRFAIGMRNANDKSMRIGLVAGYRVMVCENKMLTGDFNPLLAKHSKNFNLLDALSVGVDRIQRNIGKVKSDIELKKQKLLDNRTAQKFIYDAFMNRKMPVSLMRSVHRQFFEQPVYEEFDNRSLWSLENAFTHAFKKLKPVKQFEASAKLGKLISPYVTI
jgi:hypothetical protein